jgi:hypothetical protein
MPRREFVVGSNLRQPRDLIYFVDLFCKVFRSEGSGQQFAHGEGSGFAFVVAHDHAGIWPKFVKHLTTRPAWARGRAGFGVNVNVREASGSGGVHGLDRGLFGATAQAVTGVFDVDAGEDASIIGQECRTDLKLRVWRVGILKGVAGGLEQLVWVL